MSQKFGDNPGGRWIQQVYQKAAASMQISERPFAVYCLYMRWYELSVVVEFLFVESTHKVTELL